MLSHFVDGEGPTPARVMLIGEAPGVEELKQGRPFVGPSGRELDRYLNGYLLPSRDEVFVTNVCRTRPVTAKGVVRDPTVEEIARDWEGLELEIKLVEPEVIVTLGRSATRAFLGDVDLETVHGLPHLIRLSLPCGLTRSVVVLGAYHPAAALRSAELQGLLAYDLSRLSLYLKGELPMWARDDGPVVYQRLTGKEAVCRVLLQHS